MEFNYFHISENVTLDGLKKQYRGLCFKHHPDKGGDKDVFQEINLEYKEALELLKQRAYADNDTNYYRLINRHIYGLDNRIKNLNVPEQFKPAISYLVEKGVNELGKAIKQKLSQK